MAKIHKYGFKQSVKIENIKEWLKEHNYKILSDIAITRYTQASNTVTIAIYINTKKQFAILLPKLEYTDEIALVDINTKKTLFSIMANELLIGLASQGFGESIEQ